MRRRDFDMEDLGGEVMEKLKKPSKLKKWLGGIVIGGLVLGFVADNSTFRVDGGTFVMEQTPFGGLVAHTTPGLKFKWPFQTVLTPYDEVTTVSYGNFTRGSKGTSQNGPYSITFADTYSGQIKGSFRIEMPRDKASFLALHNAFKSYENFVQNGANKFANELLTYTANQFTGETFMQGGQNEYKNRLEDQARNGLYVTKRTAVKVQKQAGVVKAGEDNPGKTSDSEAVIYQNIIQLDPKTNLPMRQVNALSQYNVRVPQVTIDGFDPESDLNDFMTNKKDMVRKRAKLVEDQENERQQAITAKLKGDRERVEAKQTMLKEKDQAEIRLQQEVAVAKLQADKEAVERQKLADLAIIDKKKELQIATDNEAIQKANAAAAKYEGTAIKEKGLAEAAVIQAKYDAYNPKLYAMEIQRDTMQYVTANLQGINVTMPNINIAGAGSGSTLNSVDTVMQAVGIQKLDEIAASIKASKTAE